MCALLRPAHPYGEKIMAFHCPRWEELPNLDLYMEQVVTLLNQVLAPFALGEKPITPTMINNYVKQRLVKPPIKKKYTRQHMAYLVVVCLLKKVFSIPEICELIQLQIAQYPTDVAYDYFCTELEHALRTIFAGDPCFLTSTATKTTLTTEILRSTVLCFANKVYVQAGLRAKED